jgi:predicted transcriptional regulator
MREDILISMYSKSMDQIVKGLKNYEFRKYSIPSSVKRMWFYETRPLSRLLYVIEIGNVK